MQTTLFDTPVEPPVYDLGLVGCSASKGALAAPACTLYTGGIFRKAYPYASAKCRRVRIVSALHGLVEPETVLEPYNRAVDDMTAAQRREWGKRIALALDALEPKSVLWLCAENYWQYIHPLMWFKTEHHFPLRGLRQGEQMAWLKGA